MQKKNRLRLDWSLSSTDARLAFLQQYLSNITYKPSQYELEVAANYVLYGKDPDGSSIVQKKEIEIEPRNKTWVKHVHESLDSLMENPSFNESTLRKTTDLKFRVRRENFSRKEALEKCPASMRDAFEKLFRQIDELDLALNYWDLAHNKRKNPPRIELLSRFTDAEQALLKEKSTHWNQYAYLKRRHLLVELRRQQYTLRDSFITTIRRETPLETPAPTPPPVFNEDIIVLPLGICKPKSTSSLIFKPLSELNPNTYTEKDLQKVSDYLWSREYPSENSRYFDFCNQEHIYQLFQQLKELDENDINENTRYLINTLLYYIELADLNPIYKAILDMKIQKKKNEDIAFDINHAYGKRYTANYISTIFRQKICPKINKAAAYHESVVSNLFFEEEFKTCNCCKTVLLRDNYNFVRRACASDGLSGRCKRCDKKARK